MIGGKIRKLRLRKGYSLTELAKYAGVSKSYLSTIERELQTDPSHHFLSKIAPSLGTQLNIYLMKSQKKMLLMKSGKIY